MSNPQSFEEQRREWQMYKAKCLVENTESPNVLTVPLRTVSVSLGQGVLFSGKCSSRPAAVVSPAVKCGRQRRCVGVETDLDEMEFLAWNMTKEL